MKSKTLLYLATGLLLAGGLFALLNSESAEPQTATNAKLKRTEAKARNEAGTNPASEESPGRRAKSEERKAQLDALSSKYGDSRVGMAKGVATQALGLFEGLLDIAGKADLAQIAGDHELDSLRKNDLLKRLELNDEQHKQLSSMMKQRQKAVMDKVKSHIARLKDEPSPLMESLLAGDAFKRGKMSEEEWRDIQKRAKESTPSLASLSGDFASDPLQDVNWVSQAKTVLNADQQVTLDAAVNQALQEAATEDSETASQAIDMPINLDDAMELEQMEKKVGAAQKIMVGLSSMMEAISEDPELFSGKKSKE